MPMNPKIRPSMEYITSENIMLIGSLLLICGVMFGKLSYRLGLPLLLVFLLVGMGFGVDGLGVSFTTCTRLSSRAWWLCASSCFGRHGYARQGHSACDRAGCGACHGGGAGHGSAHGAVCVVAVGHGVD